MIRKRIQWKSGMTIVEVMVSFMLLLIGIGSLQQAVTFSSTMIKKAENIQKNADTLMEKYYKNDPTATDDVTVTLTYPNSLATQSTKLEIKTGEYTDSTSQYSIRFYRDKDGGGAP